MGSGGAKRRGGKVMAENERTETAEKKSDQGKDDGGATR